MSSIALVDDEITFVNNIKKCGLPPFLLQIL